MSRSRSVSPSLGEFVGIMRLQRACMRRFFRNFHSWPWCETSNIDTTLRVAAKGGVGDGKEEPPADAAARKTLRLQAIEWLRAELSSLSQEGKQNDRERWVEVIKTLHCWQLDHALAGVRDSSELARLPADEQDDWRVLWNNVASLLDELAARANRPTH